MEKRIFGLILAIAGAAGMIYAGIQFVNETAGDHTRKVIVYGVLGLIFFMSGVGLLRSIASSSKDQD